MATGDLHLLGTLYTGNTKRLMPTNPITGGNITTFVVGQTIEIRDTDADNAFKLRWREVVVGVKKHLVADRNILRAISWDNLNAQGLVAGKVITIDGQQYLLRLLTGGSNYRSGTDRYSGGTPAANEWDQIIANEAKHVGLPTPTFEDLNGANLAGAHNQFWNWQDLVSWAQEISARNGTSRAARGSASARYWSEFSSSTRYENYGWRPVLEVLHTPPEISVNINGAQKTVQSSHVKVDGVWRDVDSVYANINGIWRKS